MQYNNNDPSSIPSPRLHSRFFLTLLITLLVFILIFTSRVYSNQITVAWEPNIESNIKGYKVYYGYSTGNYQFCEDVGNITSHTILNLESNKIYYIAVTAYDISGLESDYSNEVRTTLSGDNDAPVAYDDSITTMEDTVASGTLRATDADGDTLIYSLVAHGSLGKAAITNSSTGAYTYTPDLNAAGSDTFSFKVSDGSLDSNIAVITVTIKEVRDESVVEVNHAPVAYDGSITVMEDTVTSGTLRATDGDGDVLIFSVVNRDRMSARKGKVRIENAETGTFTYRPKPNATGSDLFFFKVNDGSLDSNVAAIAVTITSVNDAPAASSSLLTTTVNMMAGNTLRATDADGDTLIYSLVAHGSLGKAAITNSSTGAYTYTPYPNVTGSDIFSFKANDGCLDSNMGVVIVDIVPGILSVYEDAEDGTIDRWVIYDHTPSGARISNIFDDQRQSRVIDLSGYGIQNAYQLRNADGTEWHNQSQFVFQWSMSCLEYFEIILPIETTAGRRYIIYTPAMHDKLGHKEKIYIGLGSGPVKGQWRTFTRDLQVDLERAQPGLQIMEVNGLLVRGNLKIDDVKLMDYSRALDFDGDGITIR